MILPTSASVASLLLSLPQAGAWTGSTPPLQPSLSRRSVLQDAASVCITVGLGAFLPPGAETASSKKEIILEELKSDQEKLQPVPDLLEEQQWDKVRTILKTPPVNKLWNLGDSQNPVLQLAKETGDIDLFELKDELAYSLQLCDQYTYDNVFVYFQPGNGKVKIKEPKEFARKAISQLQQAIDS